MKVKLLLIFAVFYIILPEYFALEVASGLPLLTGSRFLLLAVGLYVLRQNNYTLRCRHYKNLYIFLFGITALCLIHLKDSGAETVKALFSLYFEGLFLVIVLDNVIRSEYQVRMILYMLMLASVIVSVLAVFEALTGFNPFYILTTVRRSMMQTTFERIGIRRAEGPFGHPVYLTVFNVCVQPFALHYYEETRHRGFLLVLALNVLSAVMTVSRGGILAMVIMWILYYISSSHIEKLRYTNFIIMITILLLVSVIAIPPVRSFIGNMFGSIAGSFGIASKTSTDHNTLGFASRTGQLTGLIWLWRQNSFLLGLGPNAHTRGLVYYINQFSGRWNQVRSFDIGYLANFIEYGMVGFGFYLYFYASLFIASLKKDRHGLNRAFMFFYISYFLCLLSSVGIDKLFWFVTAVFIAYNSHPEQTAEEKLYA